MQQTRRSFALTAASGGLAIAASEAFAQSPNSWQSQVNLLIVADLKTTSTIALQGYAAGHIKAGDVLVLSHSLGLWAQHIHQIGAEPAAAAALAHAFDAPLSSTGLEHVRRMVLPVASGPRIESAFATLSGANTPANMSAIRSAVAGGGLFQMHRNIVAELYAFGEHLAQTGGVRLASAGELPGGARLQRVQTACQWGAIASVYLATWTVMGAMGTAAMAFLTGGTAFALLGLGLAAYGVICM